MTLLLRVCLGLGFCCLLLKRKLSCSQVEQDFGPVKACFAFAVAAADEMQLLLKRKLSYSQVEEEFRSAKAYFAIAVASDEMQL